MENNNSSFFTVARFIELTPKLTFAAEPGFVLVEPLQSDFLSDELEELVEGRAPALVVVHVLLSLLALAAVHQANLGE